jgi:hypothetical protein
MDDFNLKTITVAIMTNKKNIITNKNTNCSYNIYLEPIILTLSTFKHSFFPYNHYAPNEFVEITNFKYYRVVKRTNNNDFNTIDYFNNHPESSSNDIDSSSNDLDSSSNDLDSSSNYLQCSSNDLDSSSNDLYYFTNDLDSSSNDLDSSSNDLDTFTNDLDSSSNDLDTFTTDLDSSSNDLDTFTNDLDSSSNDLDTFTTDLDSSSNEVIQENIYTPLSLYQETLSVFMNYNNILSENAINPKLLIDFTNEVFKYKNFKDIPNTSSYLNWTNVLDWLKEYENENSILCLHIEFHYYDPHFMPDYVKYVFPYYIC